MFAARLNDTAVGTCNAHPIPTPFTAVCVLASKNVKADGLGRAHVNSVFATSCGHTFVAVSGSPLCLINALPAHRVNDIISGTGTGTTVSGSTTVKTGG
jgi:uncharacterized Zn-binding protein involved in type VI secretion